MDGPKLDRLTAHWRLWLVILWAAVSGLLLYSRWDAIRWFVLSDTDDNMRIMQVRALIAGQDWYDLRQWRMNPPFGSDIHWSRLVDLPIAGIKLALAPITGGFIAEKAAAALAPLLPMAVAMAAVAATARRLISPKAFALAVAVLLCAHSTRGMWSPMRIDHHGWQLALLSLVALAMTDPKRARGGAILGAATALSLSIGLEMLLYLALAGATVVLMWVRDPAEARRLATYGGTLAGGSALGFLLFASYANRAPVCDALSPVWLSVVVVGGTVAVLLALLSPGKSWLRLLLAAAGGAIVAGTFALAWPHCLGRLEGVSPEADYLWLSHVREALPVYRHGIATAVSIASLPVIGLAGYGVMLWRRRGDQAELVRWAAVAAPALLAALLLLWQSRAGPAAQLLAVPGATALGWLLITKLWGLTSPVGRTAGAVLAFFLVSGLLPQQIAGFVPQAKKRVAPAVNRANARCPSIPSLRPIAKVPRGYVLTFVDLGPRLISVTHHDAVTGPYHRNWADIVDVMRSFRGSAEQARQIIARRGIDYVLICPGLSESTIYAAEAKQGFYMQLNQGKVPTWLAPIGLPAGSPYKMWRVVRP